MQTISESTWEKLISKFLDAQVQAWATNGIFATAVGDQYRRGSPDTLLYIGKAGGPLIDSVGLQQSFCNNQAAAIRWMIEKRNRSAFWVFADLICSDRRSLAWTNLAKIDTRSSKPPSSREWKSISDVCMEALNEEIENLQPNKIVFVTAGYLDNEVEAVLKGLGFDKYDTCLDLERTTAYRDKGNRLAVITRHPQGWLTGPRNRVAKFISEWPS